MQQSSCVAAEVTSRCLHTLTTLQQVQSRAIQCDIPVPHMQQLVSQTAEVLLQTAELLPYCKRNLPYTSSQHDKHKACIALLIMHACMAQLMSNLAHMSAGARLWLTLVWRSNVLDAAALHPVGLVIVAHVDRHLVWKQVWREALPGLKGFVHERPQLHAIDKRVRGCSLIQHSQSFWIMHCA